MRDRTARQRLIELLRERDATASEASRELGMPEKQVYNYVEDLRMSLRDRDESLLVMPSECMECGFNEFTESLNPSRCPECRSERLSEPVFRIS